jgi:hypothetical protein
MWRTMTGRKFDRKFLESQVPNLHGRFTDTNTVTRGSILQDSISAENFSDKISTLGQSSNKKQQIPTYQFLC